MPMSTAVFAIATKNYLHYARTLMNSVREHHPDWGRFLVLVDARDGYFDPAQEPFTVIEAAALGIPEFKEMALEYPAFELSCSLKPWGAEYLFAQGFERVIYLDCDILIYRRMTELETLTGPDIVLTPHLARHLPEDNCAPTENGIITAGIFNLGFAAFKRSSSAHDLLRWWQRRLVKDCRKAMNEGIFVDQKWMDLAPGIYPSCHIFRHPGYNLAYWNLPCYSLTREGDGTVRVDGEPLAFYHFSGFDPEHPDILSRHDLRYRTRLDPIVRDLLNAYLDRLKANGYSVCKDWPVTGQLKAAKQDGAAPSGPPPAAPVTDSVMGALVAKTDTTLDVRPAGEGQARRIVLAPPGSRMDPKFQAFLSNLDVGSEIVVTVTTDAAGAGRRTINLNVLALPGTWGKDRRKKSAGGEGAETRYSLRFSSRQ